MNILRILRQQAKDYDCSVCGTNHSRSEIRVLGRVDTMWIVRVTCSKCETAIKLLVQLDDRRALARPTTEPLGRERRPPMTADDVIDAHELLEGFDGDVRTLFGAREKDAGRSTS